MQNLSITVAQQRPKAWERTGGFFEVRVDAPQPGLFPLRRFLTDSFLARLRLGGVLVQPLAGAEGVFVLFLFLLATFGGAADRGVARKKKGGANKLWAGEARGHIIDIRKRRLHEMRANVMRSFFSVSLSFSPPHPLYRHVPSEINVKNDKT